MNLCDMTYWELIKLNAQVQTECFKRVWWIFLIFILVYGIFLFKDDIKKKLKNKD